MSFQSNRTLRVANFLFSSVEKIFFDHILSSFSVRVSDESTTITTILSILLEKMFDYIVLLFFANLSDIITISLYHCGFNVLSCV